MIAGAINEARWVKREPRRTLAAQQVERVLRAAGLRSRALHLESLADGLRNANFKIRIEGSIEAVVLRLYEHDASLCQKEIDLSRLVGSAVPIPKMIHAEPGGLGDLPPFSVYRFVDAISLRELKHAGDRNAIAEAAYSAGEILARISQFEFAEPGWLGPGLTVAPQSGREADSIPMFVDFCLASANAHRRVDARLRELMHETVWHWAPRLRSATAEAHLVHGDFGKRNLLVHCTGGSWSVAAVLDWEFACSGSPLSDAGEFLRYERASDPSIEPFFSRGFRDAGGKLAPDWRELARTLDLAKLCDSLTRDYLPEQLVPELLELVAAAVEGREPQPVPPERR
jgi:aminoglycoside phosphotransferase (APT) family kinase protein